MDDTPKKSALVARNVFVGTRRTSIKLEPALWRAFEEICEKRSKTIHQVCTHLAPHAGAATLTSAVRVYVVEALRQQTMARGWAA
jgi:predicted DNA-binding ribbon-helix-helix protein